MIKGLRGGIERASKIVLPTLIVVILVLMVRSLTLPGAMEGVRWYILKFRFADLTPTVMVAAIGHAIFSLSLGGTFMVVYGSYLDAKESLARPAIWTVIGDTGSALLAASRSSPRCSRSDSQPTSGPGLIFATLPKVFAAIPVRRAVRLSVLRRTVRRRLSVRRRRVRGARRRPDRQHEVHADARGLDRVGRGVRARNSADDQQRASSCRGI